MNRKLPTTLLLTLVLAALVAPAAAPAQGYSAGNFELSIEGHRVYDGPGELSSASTLILTGARTPALESWAGTGDLRAATVVQEYDSGRVVKYSIVNAWTKHTDGGVTVTFGSTAS